MEAHSCESEDNLFSDSTVQSDDFTSEEYVSLSEDEIAAHYASLVIALLILWLDLQKQSQMAILYVHPAANTPITW